jgi:hypothetical protein
MVLTPFCFMAQVLLVKTLTYMPSCSQASVTGAQVAIFIEMQPNEIGLLSIMRLVAEVCNI